MADLSPAAQAVRDALEEWIPSDFVRYELRKAATVLRAAADQVVPEFWHEDNDIYGETMQEVRENLLAIAAELEGSND